MGKRGWYIHRVNNEGRRGRCECVQDAVICASSQGACYAQ